MKLTKEFWIPKGRIAIRFKKIEAVVYVTDKAPFLAAGFSGKRTKPDFNYRYSSMEAMEKGVQRWIDGLVAAKERRAQAGAARAAFQHTLKVGDMVSSSWGYEQTNVDFYEVTAVIGKAMVEIREVAQQREDTGYLTGNAVPVPGKFIGKPMRRRVGLHNTLTVDCSRRCSPYEMHEVAPGVKVGRPLRWSAYA